MFQGWAFLLVEIWVLLALAAVIGLIAGGLIFGGQKPPNDFEELERLKIELQRVKTALRKSEAGYDPARDAALRDGGYVRPAIVRAVKAEMPRRDPPNSLAALQSGPITPNTEAVMAAATTPGLKPVGLAAPRDGLPDDLTKIKGVGAKLEALCHSLGIWHYDQIAAWREAEVIWMDDNLEGFRGRVSRDGWVTQAKALAQNRTPVFRRRT